MARLVLHVELLLDVIDLLALVGTYRFLHVPLHHLTVDKQRGVSVAATVEGGVQRPQAQFRLGDDDLARVLEFIGEQVVQPVDGNHRYRWRQLAVGNEVLAIG